MIAKYHQGQYLQRGRGFGGIFAALFRVLKPLLSKGASHALKAGKSALKDASVKKALHSVKNSALKSGTSAIDKALNPKKKGSAKSNLSKAKKRVLSAVHKKNKSRKIDNSIFS